MGASFKAAAKKKRELIPEGQYDAICFGVIELGTHMRESKFGVKTNEEIMLFFEIPELQVEYEKDGKTITGPRVMNRKFNNVMGEKANLRLFLQSWRGKPYTDEEAYNLDVSKVLGHGLQINVVHSENGEYANIGTVAPLHKSVKMPPIHNPLINFGITDIKSPLFDELYPWVQDIIKDSFEYKEFEARGGKAEVQEEDNDIPF